MARSKLFLFSLLLLVLSSIAAHGAGEGDPPKAAKKTGPRLLFPSPYKSLRLEQPAPSSFDGGTLGAEHSRWSVGVDWGRENEGQPGECNTD